MFLFLLQFGIFETEHNLKKRKEMTQLAARKATSKRSSRVFLWLSIQFELSLHLGWIPQV